MNEQRSIAGSGYDVIGLGTVVVDHLVTLPGPPQLDVKHEITGYHTQVGGPVPTALVLLQRWGLRTAFVGGWSDDAHGELIGDDLQREGVDTSFALREPGQQSGFAHVWVDPKNATRTIAYSRCSLSWTSWEWAHLPLDATRWVHLDGWPADVALALATEAKRNGCRISLDTGSAKPGLDALIPLLDVMNCSRRFLRAYLGEDDPEIGARELVSRGPRWVTVTEGSRGAWLATPDEVIFQPAFPVQAVDTTGAGDIFTAGLVYAVDQGWTPARVLRTACASSALKCSALGNRMALPALVDVMALVDGASL